MLQCPHALPIGGFVLTKNGLGHRQQGSVSIGQQVRARCLPRAGRIRPVLLSSSLGAPPSERLHLLRVRLRGPGGTEISGAQQRDGSHATIQRPTLTNLHKVQSAPQDLLVDRRVKGCRCIVRHATEFVKIPLTEFALKKLCHDTYYRSRFVL